MSEKTKIQWTDHTGGPWMICTEVSPGCAHCYARELMQARLFPIVRKAYKAAGFADWETRPVWGDKAPRVLSKGFWDDARRINKQAAKDGTRPKWFPSLIDWLDAMPAGIIDQDGNWLDSTEVLARFLDLVRECEHIDWLLLTKRPELFESRLMAVRDFQGKKIEKDPEGDSDLLWYFVVDWMASGSGDQRASAPKPPNNIWPGTTVEDQTRADERIPHLLRSTAVCRFLSVEPQLGPVDLRGWLEPVDRKQWDGLKRQHERDIHWVIVGGESGPKARPFSIEWARSIVRQCREAGVPVFVKQLGAVIKDRNDAGFDGESPTEWPMGTEFDDGYFDPSIYQGKPGRVVLRDRKGGTMEEWPEDLRVREWPEVEGAR